MVVRAGKSTTGSGADCEPKLLGIRALARSRCSPESRDGYGPPLVAKMDNGS